MVNLTIYQQSDTIAPNHAQYTIAIDCQTQKHTYNIIRGSDQV